MRDGISHEAKEALANLATVRRRRRLDRDGCSKGDAVRRRLRYIAAERKLEPAEIAKVIARRLRLDDLAGFAQQHGISMDWLLFGDLHGLALASSRDRRRIQPRVFFKRTASGRAER
jgi:hypothetical protein